MLSVVFSASLPAFPPAFMRINLAAAEPNRKGKDGKDEVDAEVEAEAEDEFLSSINNAAAAPSAWIFRTCSSASFTLSSTTATS